MIDFACKRFDLDDIIKCGLGLTKTEFKIMKFLLKNSNKKHTTNKISKKLNLNLTTIQKAVKKLSKLNIIKKSQKNLLKGGYIYIYKCNPKEEVRTNIKKIIRNWSNKVEEEIDKW